MNGSLQISAACRLTVAVVALIVLTGCGDKLGGKICPDTHRRQGEACIPIFDDCPGPAEIPVLGGGCRPVGVTQCATGFVSDNAGGCDPILPEHECPPGTMEMIGNTECVAVGVSQCATGFVTDGEGGCDAILPTEPCPDGTMEVLGDTECQSIGDCGVGTWGLIQDDGTTVYVDASSVAAVPDGSVTAPYPTVAEALAEVLPGGQVAIAAGDYSERLVIDKEVRLSGRCAAMVTLHGRRILGTDYSPVSIGSGGSGTTVSGVTLTGDARGLVTSGAQGVTVDEVQVLDTGSYGLSLSGESEVILRRAVVAGATDLGVYSQGSFLELRQSVVRDTRPLPDGTWGRGIHAQCSANTGPCGSLRVEGSLVAGNRDMGIYASGVEATITSSVVRDTLPKESDQKLGRGIFAQCSTSAGVCGSLRVVGSLVAGNRDMGIYASGVEATITSSVVRDTLPDQSDQSFGRGIETQCSLDLGTCGSLLVEGSLVAGNREMGIITFGVEATVTSSVVRDTLPQQSDRTGGKGIEAQCDDDLGLCGSLQVEGSLVTGNRYVGIIAAGVDATVTSSVVRDTLPQLSDQHYGGGIAAQCHPTLGTCGRLHVEDSVVAGNRYSGIFAAGVDATVTSSVVRDTLHQQSDLLGGRGINVECNPDLGSCGSLRVEGSLVTGNQDVGVYASGAEVTVTSSVVRDTLPLQIDQSFGRGISVQCDHRANTCGSLHVEGSLVAGNYNTGILAASVTVTLIGVAVTDTWPDQDTQGIWTGHYGQGIWAGCDEHYLDNCGSLEMTACLVRSSYTAGVAVQGIAGFIESSLIDIILPRPLDNGFGYGIQIEGLPGDELPVFDITSTQIGNAPLASILYYRAIGTVTDTVTSGADFAVVWAASPQKPTIGSSNVLEGKYEDGLTQQDLQPSPAPEPAVPIGVGL